MSWVRVSDQWRGPGWLKSAAESFNIEVFQRATHVTLSGPSVDDDIVPYLLELKHLQQVEIGVLTSLSAEARDRLRQGLPKCQVVQLAFGV